jgi:hypothetical protein
MVTGVIIDLKPFPGLFHGAHSLLGGGAVESRTTRLGITDTAVGGSIDMRS